MSTARRPSPPSAEVRRVVQEAIQRHPTGRGELLEILREIQEELRYIPTDAVNLVARLMRLRPAEVYGTLTFYSDFRTSPPADHSIGLCNGPACHLRGIPSLRRMLEREFDLDQSGHSFDGSLEVRSITCPGLCSLAPLITVDDAVRARVYGPDLERILDELRLRRLAETGH